MNLTINIKKPWKKLALSCQEFSMDGNLCEIAEIKDHPWMIGVQFHPEFKSKPIDPHPLFREFINAMITHKKKMEKTKD